MQTFLSILNDFLIPLITIATFILIVAHRIEDTKQRKIDTALQYKPLLEFEYNPDLQNKSNITYQSKFNKEISFNIDIKTSNDEFRRKRIEDYINDPNNQLYDTLPLCIKNMGSGNAYNVSFEFEPEEIISESESNWRLFEKTKIQDTIPVLISQKNYIINQNLYTILHIPYDSILNKIKSHDFSFNIKIKVTYYDEFLVNKYEMVFNEEIIIHKNEDLNKLCNLKYTLKNISLISLDKKQLI